MFIMTHGQIHIKVTALMFVSCLLCRVCSGSCNILTACSENHTGGVCLIVCDLET
jgi:hypothetical protein